MTSIDRLKQVLKKPRETHFAVTDSQRWEEVENRLSASFPRDFKDFVGCYGTGNIGDFITVFNPFPTHKPPNFFENMDFVLSVERQFKSLPFPIFSESGVILPFAKTYDGDNLFWLTNGDSDRWPIIALAVRSSYHEIYPYAIGEFFYKLITAGTDDSNENILKDSWIFGKSFNQKAKFESYCVQIRNNYHHLRQSLCVEASLGRRTMSKQAFENLLARYWFEISDAIVQETIQDWVRSSFIEIIGQEDSYVRIKPFPL